MSLNFIQLLTRFVIIPLKDLNRAWHVIMANTGQHTLARRGYYSLWQAIIEICMQIVAPLLRDLIWSQHLIIANSEHLILFVWNVDNAAEPAIFLVVVFVTIARTLLRRIIPIQIVKVDGSPKAASWETHIILEPSDTLHSLNVANEHHRRRNFLRVKIVNMNILLVHNAGEKSATMRETDLIAPFDIQCLCLAQTIRQNIENFKFVRESN